MKIQDLNKIEESALELYLQETRALIKSQNEGFNNIDNKSKLFFGGSILVSLLGFSKDLLSECILVNMLASGLLWFGIIILFLSIKTREIRSLGLLVTSYELTKKEAIDEIIKAYTYEINANTPILKEKAKLFNIGFALVIASILIIFISNIIL